MKNIQILLAFILMFGLTNSAKADTIDYCYVYYNNVKIEEFTLYSEYTAILKLKDIKEKDSLKIQYFRDTPCSHAQQKSK